MESATNKYIQREQERQEFIAPAPPFTTFHFDDTKQTIDLIKGCQDIDNYQCQRFSYVNQDAIQEDKQGVFNASRVKSISPIKDEAMTQETHEQLLADKVRQRDSISNYR